MIKTLRAIVRELFSVNFYQALLLALKLLANEITREVDFFVPSRTKWLKLPRFLHFQRETNTYFRRIQRQQQSSTMCPIRNERFTLSIRGYACVTHCNFHDISSESRGGIIGSSASSISNTSVTRIFIEEKTFATFKTTNSYGVGIYFSNTKNVECVIFYTCLTLNVHQGVQVVH